MAEKDTARHTISVTLTYNEETERSRDGARQFQYKDVQVFMSRLRRAQTRQNKRLLGLKKSEKAPQTALRFICAGEQGDRNGRCHWHIILFSDLDLTTVGQFSMRGQILTERKDLVSEGKRIKRLHWSMWDHGFVTIQEPDQSGMNYALSYALKDQFTAEKSEGTKRQAKVENFATGYFAMSKKDAIGSRWIGQKIGGLANQGSCLTNLKIKIPHMHGYWAPSGTSRVKVLWLLNAANQKSRFLYGRDAAQWSTLLHMLKDNEKDMEILKYDQGEQERRQAEVEQYDAKTKQIRELARSWELDAIGEDKRLEDWTAEQALRAGRSCLCQECVTRRYGKPYWSRQAGQDFYFTEGGGAELAGREALETVIGNNARCEVCGSKNGLWLVEPRPRAG